MLSLIIAAYLSSSPGHQAPIRATTPRPTTSSKPPTQVETEDVWLDCIWQEVWKSTVVLGGQAKESTSEHQYGNTYVISKRLNKIFLYQDESKTLYQQAGEIAPAFIVIDEQDHDQSMLGESKRQRLWSVSRQDLKVKLFGSSERNVRMDDGRILTSSILMTGEGACVLSSPKPITPVLPNKF